MLQRTSQVPAPAVETTFAHEQGEIISILDKILKLLDQYDRMPLVAIAPEIDMPVACNLLPAIQTMVEVARTEIAAIATPTQLH